MSRPARSGAQTQTHALADGRRAGYQLRGRLKPLTSPCIRYDAAQLHLCTVPQFCMLDVKLERPPQGFEEKERRRGCRTAGLASSAGRRDADLQAAARGLASDGAADAAEQGGAAVRRPVAERPAAHAGDGPAGVICCAAVIVSLDLRHG